MSIVKRGYDVGGLYKDFTNLELVGDYQHEVKIFHYEEGNYLTYSLRFKRFNDELPCDWLCTEILDNFHFKALKSLETLVVEKDKDFLDKIIDRIEKFAKG